VNGFQISRAASADRRSRRLRRARRHGQTVLESVPDQIGGRREAERLQRLVLVGLDGPGRDPSTAAASFMVRPSARSRTTSRWRGVSCRAAGGGNAEDRQHGPTDQEADGDGGRRVPGRRRGLHQAAERVRQTLLRLVQHDRHAPPDARQALEPRAVRPLAVRVPRRDDRSRQAGRRAPQAPRRPRHRQRHVRHVLHRQRAAPEQLARRGHDPLPQREELELGGSVPRAGHDAVAGADQARHGLQRDREPPGLAPDVPGHGRGRRYQGQAPEGLSGRLEDVQGPSGRLQPGAVPDREGVDQRPQGVLLLLR
jgi:hypothetical protein